jgi:serine/threonine protein kinase/tetratricopeptide (TPR) repeat protein
MALSVGTRLGPYEIIDPLGAGGMGEVYRATDLRLGRTVAIKVLPAAPTRRRERLRRFEFEARAAAALSHPNVLAVYDVGEHLGEPFIVTELLEGQTLRQYLSGRPLPQRRAIEIARQVADGLAAAHAKGIVHRDIKPANVFVLEGGAVKILDFGIAKLLDPIEPEELGTPELSPTALATDLSPTSTLRALGTPGYLAPEQLQGKEPDGRADIFALGSVLYEMLTGRRAFTGTTQLEVLEATMAKDPAPLAQRAPDVSPAVVRIVERCLEKHREDRFASAHDLGLALEAAQEDITVSRLPFPVARPARRHRGKLGIGAIALAGLVVGITPPARRAVLSWWPKPPLPAEKHVAVVSFASSARDDADAPLCAGLARTLTSKVALLENPKAGLSMAHASGGGNPGIARVEDARRDFGVTLAITGALECSKSLLRLQARLVDAATLRGLRAATMSAPAGQLASLEGDAVREFARMLEVEVPPEVQRAIQAEATAVGGAYAHYLRGVGHLQRYEKVENLEAAVSCFQRALEQDERFALAYARLAEAYVRRWEAERSPQWMDLARRNAQKALEINDLLAPVHVTLGIAYRETGRREDAVSELEAALKLDPSSSDTHRELGRTYESLNRFDDAEGSFRRAIELQPGLWSNHNALGVFYHRRDRYSDAVPPLRRAVELAPDNARCLYNLGGAYYGLNLWPAAIASYERALALKPTYQTYTSLGTVYFFQGRFGEAAGMAEKAVELNSTQYVAWGNLADCYRWAPGLEMKAPDAYRRAIGLAERDLGINPNDARLHAYVAGYLAKLGEDAKARAEIRTAMRLAPKDNKVQLKAATVYELGGERASALEALAAARAGGSSMVDIANDPELAKLRQDARYAEAVGAKQPAPIVAAAQK